jgi:hypothetical protein
VIVGLDSEQCIGIDGFAIKQNEIGTCDALFIAKFDAEIAFTTQEAQEALMRQDG